MVSQVAFQYAYCRFVHCTSYRIGNSLHKGLYLVNQSLQNQMSEGLEKYHLILQVLISVVTYCQQTQSQMQPA